MARKDNPSQLLTTELLQVSVLELARFSVGLASLSGVETFRTILKLAIAETGIPLENLFETIAGGLIEAVEVETFEPPIDLTGKVLVALTFAEARPLLALMRLVCEHNVQDVGTELMRMKQVREEKLEFRMPVTARPCWCAIRISFQRPVDRSKNRQLRPAIEELLPV